MTKLMDIFGRVFGKTPGSEHKSRVASTGPRDWADLNNVLSNVTPATLRSIFEDADNGLIGRQVELAQTIRERDDHLRSVDQTRRLAVCGVEYIIEPGDDSDQAAAAADAFRAVWEQHGEGLVGRMMDAILEQWHVEEIVWDTDGKLDGKRFWWPAAIEEVDGRKLCWPYHQGDDPAETVAPRIMRNWSSTDAQELTPGKYIVHSYSAVRGRPGRGSLIRCVAALWMFKRFSLIDLATLIEQWGRPWPVLKYDSRATPEQVADWLETLADSMADRAIAIPAGSECEVKAAGAAGADTPHINLVDLCNRGMSKVMVGSTTIAEAANESRNVSSPTHAEVRTDIRNADAKAIAVSIQSCLVAPFTLWNFGDVAAPKITPNLSAKPDPASRAAIFEAAARLRMRVNSQQLYSELGIEKPEDVEEVIELGAEIQGSGFRVQGSEQSDIDAAVASEDTAFKKEVLRAFLADRTVNDILFNSIQVSKLLEQLGLPVQPGYEEPWVPVRDDTGALISGDAIEDDAGDVVGGKPIAGSAPMVPVFGQPGGKGSEEGEKGEEGVKSEKGEEGEESEKGEESDR